MDNLTKGPGRDFANFSLVSVIRRWSSARELGIELFLGCWKGAMQRETSGRRVMRIMEGQGVDGHVGDESSPKRNAFVRVFENVSLSLSSLFSLLFLSLSLLLSLCLVLSSHSPVSVSSLSRLVLSCLVLSCLVHVLSCLVLSCLVLSCLVLSCLVLSCLVLSDVLSCLVVSCLVLSCLVLCLVSCVSCVCVCLVVCWRVCVWRAAHSPQFPSGELEYNSFIRYSE